MCEQDGVHSAAGLVSWGPPSTNSNKPGVVYTNVSRFADWIQENMSNDDLMITLMMITLPPCLNMIKLIMTSLMMRTRPPLSDQ